MSEALTPAPAEPTGSAALPEAFRDPATGPRWGEIVARLSGADELEAAATERAAGVPADPAAYAFAPSGDPILGPDGKPLAIDPANSLAQAIAAAAHKHGVPQAAVSDFARAFIETNIAGDQAVDEAFAADRAALGDNAGEREENAHRFARTYGATDEQISILRDIPSFVPLLEALQARIGGTAVVPPEGGQHTERKFGHDWFPSMNKRG